MFLKVGKPRPYIMLIPLIGMGLFIGLYFLAAMHYPGGSWNFSDDNGFSFLNNYLCDLLDDYAINGEINSARVFARAGLGILCFSLILLWFYLPQLFETSSVNLIIMWLAGQLALVITVFLASGSHDVILRIAGVFGVIALITSFVELYKIRLFNHLRLGTLCLIIFFINYYIYETGVFIKALPVIQKITFSCFIIWFTSLDIYLYKKLMSDSNK